MLGPPDRSLGMGIQQARFWQSLSQILVILDDFGEDGTGLRFTPKNDLKQQYPKKESQDDQNELD